MTIAAATPLSRLTINFNPMSRYPTSCHVTTDEDTPQRGDVFWGMESAAVTTGSDLLTILKEKWNGAGFLDRDGNEITPYLGNMVPSSATLDALPVGWYHPFDETLIRYPSQRIARTFADSINMTLQDTDDEYTDSGLDFNEYSTDPIPKTAIIGVELSVRVQNRFNVPIYISRENIEDTGYRASSGWATEWSVGSSSIVPCAFIDWLHSTGPEKRGIVLTSPNFFHMNAARIANYSAMSVFFLHSSSTPDDFAGISVLAFSDSSLRLRYATVYYDGTKV